MTSISDNFNRANEALTAGPWAVSGGTWTVTSNEVLTADITGWSWARHTTALASSDQRVTYRYQGDEPNLGLAARLSSDFQTGYFINMYNSAIREFWRIAAGTETFISEPGSVAVAINDIIYLEVEGSTLRAGVEGGSEITTTDSNVTTGLYAGLGASQNGKTFDDWTAQDLAAAAVPDLFVVRSPLQLG